VARRQGLAPDFDLSGGGVDETQEHTDRGGLAGPVGPRKP
jgi:hypothetical protein